MRSSALAREELPFAVASGLEHGLNEAKHSAIRYALGDEREKLFVTDRPEEISEISIRLRSKLDGVN